jgi:3-oxoadipate enol-lactonase
VIFELPGSRTTPLFFTYRGLAKKDLNSEESKILKGDLSMLLETISGILDVEQDGQGRDLVLLHSLLADRTAFDRVRPALAKNHRLWLVNLPGYGMSTPRSVNIESYADQIADMMSTLGLPQQADVLGNGLGGFISLALAIRHGEKFDRLIVADALSAFPEAGKEALRVMAGTIRDKGMAAGLDTAIQRMFPPFHPGLS